MEKIKRYIDCYVPVTTCNLRCPYCYVTNHHLFKGPLPEFKYSPEHVRKSLSKERLGGTCLINFCADGETLLTPYLIDYVKELLLEGHFIMIVTNGTLTNRLKEYASLPSELTKHLFFKFSYHYLEFKKKNLFEQFFNNVRTVRDAGCSFTLELTPSDEAIPFIDDIKERALKELGALCHVTIARDEKDDSELPMLTKLSKQEYIEKWGTFDSELFDFKLKLFEVKRKEFCYAGDWSILLDFLTGDTRPCYFSPITQNIFENIDKPIAFQAIGPRCRSHYCYNGHSFLALGNIPSVVAPSYAEERNRICMDGTEWLRPEFKKFISSRLFESNKEYSFYRKTTIGLSVSLSKTKQKGNGLVSRIKSNMKKAFK